MRAVRNAIVSGTSQERHEGGAPYHRPGRRATGLWMVASMLFTNGDNVEFYLRSKLMTARSYTSSTRRIHSLSAGALGSFDRAPRATFRCNGGTLRGERSRRRR